MAPNNKRKTGGAQLPTPPSAFIALCAAKGIIVPTATAEWLKLRHLTGPDYSTAAAKKDAAAAWAWARANASVGADGSVVADWSSPPTAAAAFVRKITANPYKTNTDSEDVAGAKLVQLMDGLPSSATPAPVTPATATAPLASAPRHNLNAQQVAALELLFGPIDSLSDVELASMVSRALPAAAPQTPLPPPIVTPAPAAATAAVATAAPATPAGPMLVPSTPYTQDQICAGLGARHTLFALYLTWTADQRKAWAVQAKNANAGGGFSFPGEATLQGAYGFLLQVTQFLPASEDRERKLGEKLALVGRFQTPKRTGEEADIAFTDAFRVRASTAWADLIAAGATGFEAAQGVLEPCFRIVNSHMTRRAGFMQGILQAGGLPALIPFFVTQAAEVATLLEDAPSRHAEAYPKTSFAEDARSRNEAYHDLLAAFFKDIAGVRVMPGPWPWRLPRRPAAPWPGPSCSPAHLRKPSHIWLSPRHRSSPRHRLLLPGQCHRRRTRRQRPPCRRRWPPCRRRRRRGPPSSRRRWSSLQLAPRDWSGRPSRLTPTHCRAKGAAARCTRRRRTGTSSALFALRRCSDIPAPASTPRVGVLLRTGLAPTSARPPARTGVRSWRAMGSRVLG